MADTSDDIMDVRPGDLSLNPTFGLDPRMAVRSVSLVPQQTYPNPTVAMLDPLSITAAPPGTNVPLVQGANLQPQRMAEVAPVIPTGSVAPPVQTGEPQPQQVAQIAPQTQQQIAPQTPAPAPPRTPGAQIPGAGQGPMGGDVSVGPQYDPNANNLENQRAITKSLYDKAYRLGFGKNMQTFEPELAKQWREKAAEYAGKLNDIEKQIQEQDTNMKFSRNAGLWKPMAATADKAAVVEEQYDEWRHGNYMALRALSATGHADQAHAYDAEGYASLGKEVVEANKLFGVLDSVTNADEWGRKRADVLRDAKKINNAGNFGLTDANIPTTLGQYKADPKAVKVAVKDATQLVNNYNRAVANQDMPRPITDKAVNDAVVGESVKVAGKPSPHAVGRELPTLGNQKAVLDTEGTANIADYKEGGKWTAWGEDQKNAAQKVINESPELKGVLSQHFIAVRYNKVVQNDENYNDVGGRTLIADATGGAFRDFALQAQASGNVSLVKILEHEMGTFEYALNQIYTNTGSFKNWLTTGMKGEPPELIKKSLVKEWSPQTIASMKRIGEFNLGEMSAQLEKLQGVAKYVGEHAGHLGDIGIGDDAKPYLQPYRDQAEHQQRLKKDSFDRIIVNGRPYSLPIDHAVDPSTPGFVPKGTYQRSLDAIKGDDLKPPPPPAPGAFPTRGTAPVPFTAAPAAPAVPGPRTEAAPPAQPLATRVGNVLQGALGISSAQAAEAPAQTASPPVGAKNYAQATADLNLSPQERALYERHLTNLNGRGGVDNADGSRSTLLARTVGFGDKTHIIPTVYDGKIVNTDEAIARAKAQGVDNFPSYASFEEAKARYDKMHAYMDKDTGEHLANRRTPQRVAQAAIPSSWGAGTGAGGGGLAVPAPARQSATLPSVRPEAVQPATAATATIPNYIRNNPVASTVYKTAHDTAFNLSGGNATVGKNVAAVATSSAQSESAFKPHELHDPDKVTGEYAGYGLYGHQGSRLAAMQKSAGVAPVGKPDAAILPEAQTAFYAREIMDAAKRDPFIAKVLNDPNASAEDLTRVQMRMEQPKGYVKGQEEQGLGWNNRLSATQTALLGQRGRLTTTPQAAEAGYYGSQSAVGRAAVRNAPAVGAGLGNIAGAPFGPVAQAGGTIAGGVTGGLIQHAITAPPEQRTWGDYTEAGIKGGIESLPGAIPGQSWKALGARALTAGGVEGAKEYYETGEIPKSLNVAGGSIFTAAGAEGFMLALGKGFSNIYKMATNNNKLALENAGEILSKEKAKTMLADGTTVDNQRYLDAEKFAKDRNIPPDHLAHAFEEAQKMSSKGEALMSRPGYTGQKAAGRELEEVKNQVGAASATIGVTRAQQVLSTLKNPHSIVGVNPNVPDSPYWRGEAQVAAAQMGGPARNLGEVLDNFATARSALLKKQVAAEALTKESGQAFVRQDEMVKGYGALADHIRSEQENLIRRALPNPAEHQPLIDQLNAASARYRIAIKAGGPNIVDTIAAGGSKGNLARNAFNNLAGNDQDAKNMMQALTTMKGRQGKAAGLTLAISASGMLSFVPIVGPAAAAVGVTLSAAKLSQLAQDYMVQKGANKMVTMKMLIGQDLRKTQDVMRRTGAVLGGSEGANRARAFAQPEQSGAGGP